MIDDKIANPAEAMYISNKFVADDWLGWKALSPTLLCYKYTQGMLSYKFIFSSCL